MAEHRAYKAGRFDYQRLDAYAVAKEALGDDAFVGHRHQWSADREHTKGYVEEAAKVLRGL